MIANWEIEKKEGSHPQNGTFLSFFWIGFIIYNLGYVSATTQEVSYVVGNAVQVIGLVLFVPSAFFLINLNLKNNYLRILFPIYLLWVVGVLIRGIQFDYLTIKQLLFDPETGVFLYLIPVVILIPMTPRFLKTVFSVIIVLGFFYLIYDLIFIQRLINPENNMRSQAIIERFTQYLSLTCGFFLITHIYHHKRLNLFALFIMSLTFILAVIRARRGLMFMSMSMLLAAMLFYQIKNKTNVVNIVLSFFLVVIFMFAAIKIYENNRETTFGLITQRFGQHTRSAVEQYFYQDLSMKDWIIGKGFNGQYFCPGVSEGVGRVSIYRKVIETGYLQVILNGGLINLILLILIAVPAIIKGIFHSKNLLSKAAGTWIFLFLLFMYPGVMTIFSLYYILVWICIGICYSSDFLNLSDEEIINGIANVQDRKPIKHIS